VVDCFEFNILRRHLTVPQTVQPFGAGTQARRQ